MKLKYTKIQIALEIVGLLLIIGMIIFICVRWNQIPQKIPGHYNAMGEIDRWGSKSEILIMPIVGILLYIFITIMSFFPLIWNVPIQVTDENKEAVYLVVKSLIIFTKIEMLGMFFYINYYTATSQSLPIVFLPVSMMILFGTIIFFILRTYRTGKKKKV
ncbi:MAG: DUF1648 domain-containing protein [Ignavibacteriaceae bacterium]|nr:DUF1648 domain-containing protein [Ignavibacteriaceae bacterium]